MDNCGILSVLKVTDVTQQKKAYRVLEQICGADSESSKNFVVSHLKELQEILLKTLASSSSASKTVSTVMSNYLTSVFLQPRSQGLSSYRTETLGTRLVFLYNE